MRFPLRPQYASRYADLARLLMRYGRSDLLAGVGLDDFGETESAAAGDAEDRAHQLAADLERMGPTYIKFGQLLSTRVDLLPRAYTDALTRLQDDVEPFSFAEVEQIVTQELGVSLRHGFTSFQERPLAAASLAQVHRAELRSGRQVVVKVQRPGVRELVRDDMAALGELAEFADSHTDIGRRFGLGELLAQFRRSLAGELDYQREAANLIRVQQALQGHPRMVVPSPVQDYSTSSVLTMDYIAGRKITDIGPVGRLDLDGEALVADLFKAYLQMILSDGFFHADPHPGNLLLTPDARIALIDLGMVATLTAQMQDRLVKLLLAISDGDGQGAASILAVIGHPLDGYDEHAFRAGAADIIAAALSAPNGVQAGTVLVDLSRLSGACGLRPPAEMALVGKALLNLDETTTHLDPSFDPSQAIRTNLAQIMQSRMHSSPASLLTAAMEAKDFTARLPGRVNSVLDSLAQGSFTVKVDALDEVQFLHVLQRLATRLTMGLVLAALVVGAALMMQVPTKSRILGYPAIAMVLFLLAALAGTMLLASILITDRRIARRSKANRTPSR
ncbi:MAG: AarF/UbiB family protein [Actinomycetota bacterium]|nr:AarF/UbiB family protein [Actinomycetota bacterium]